MGPLGKCLMCLDTALQAEASNGAGDGPQAGRDDVMVFALPDAVVAVTVVQKFGQIVAPAAMAVCLPCRRKQVSGLSKSGLQLG